MHLMNCLPPLLQRPSCWTRLNPGASLDTNHDGKLAWSELPHVSGRAAVMSRGGKRGGGHHGGGGRRGGGMGGAGGGFGGAGTGPGGDMTGLGRE